MPAAWLFLPLFQLRKQKRLAEAPAPAYAHDSQSEC
jgi:hypothetical protein